MGDGGMGTLRPPSIRLQLRISPNNKRCPALPDGRRSLIPTSYFAIRNSPHTITTLSISPYGLRSMCALPGSLTQRPSITYR